jgi:8-oxo-dGTP pyrophosphatase MutT (NUDIX family)
MRAGPHPIAAPSYRFAVIRRFVPPLRKSGFPDSRRYAIGSVMALPDPYDPSLPPVRPAASLILFHERGEGPPDLLICQRGAAMAFAAGAFVFPGGRVDDEDGVAAESLLPDLPRDDAAARIAALRELEEETGIVGLDPRVLRPFARWLPAERVPRRFDTRFYLAKAPERFSPVADGGETVACFWASAAEMTERCRRGEGRMLFPTRRILERLARFASFAEAAGEAARLPERIVTPWLETLDGQDWLCIPEDAGYPVTREPIETAMRY